MAANAPVNWTAMFDRVKGSIFYVLVEPKEDKIKDLQVVANRVKAVRGSAERRKMVRSGYSSTGFSFMEGPTVLYIATTAHSLQHLFKASDPITAGTMDMFNVSVLCYHFEHDYQEAGLVGDRKHAKAYMMAMDCDNDILIVAVAKEDLKNFADDQVCVRGHPCLRISQHKAREARDCMLVSWPSHKPCKVSRGFTSISRMISAISSPNRVEYSMTLLECHMSTEKGSSGAPLLDDNEEVIGMLHGGHGGHGGPDSYFVAASHLQGWVLSPDLLNQVMDSVITLLEDLTYSQSRRSSAKST
ncbi:hypothetical protein ACQJBY_033709 [Aegilops geniculata]